MAKENAHTVNFAYRRRQQNFRLLELPPELAHLLTSENPPTLYLKSPAPSENQPPSKSAQDQYVNLCTPTQTYFLRQVHSSNSIFIVKPSPQLQQQQQQAVAHDGAPGERGTLAAIAQCKSTLELQKPGDGYSAMPFLLEGLRVYGGMQDVARADDDGDVDMDIDGWKGGGHGDTKKAVMDRFFADVPLSRAECTKAWFEICAFVTDGGSQGLCWQPSVTAKLDIWKMIVEASVLGEIDLGSQFLVADLWAAVVSGEDGEGSMGIPRGLFDAVVMRLSDGISEEDICSEFRWAKLDKYATVSWVGQVCLEATAPSPVSAVSRDKFLDAWKDLLPESWRNEATWDSLKGNCYQFPDVSTVCFKMNDIHQDGKKTKSKPK